MPIVSTTTAVWSGFQGAPGYTKFHWQELSTDTARNAAGAAMKAFFGSMANYLATTWSVQVQAEVVDYDLQTGQLAAANAMTVVPAVTGGQATLAPFAGGSGICITWHTPGVFHGRRVAGRTFLVPVIGVFENDGTPTAAVAAAIVTAGNTLIAVSGADFAIYARHYDHPKPPHTQIEGGLFSVTSVTVRDAASGLRSRRS